MSGQGERVVVGRVSGAHGVKGMLRVRFLGDDAGHLLGSRAIWLSSRDEAPESDPGARRHEVVERGAGRPGEVRLALRGVLDRDAARALQGAWVLLPVAELRPLEEGEHYWYELVGCRVEDQGGRTLGVVRELWDTPGHDLLVVVDDAGREHLIPAAPPFLRDVDLEAQRIRIDTIPGLVEP